MQSVYCLILCSGTLLFFLLHSYQAPAKNLRILIDSDIGLGKFYDPKKAIPADIDDAYAILNALHSPQLEVAGITTVFGNTQVEAANQSVQKILGLSKNSHIPWNSGAIESGKEKNPCPSGAKRAAESMAKSLQHSPAYILAIGPLTNISCMLATHKEVSSKINEVLVVMGQSTNIEFSINNIHVQDLNFESDILAAKTLLKSKIPMSFFPFELTKKILINHNRIRQINSRNTLVNYLRNSSFDFINHWHKVFKEDGFHPWDNAPVAYLKNPEWFRCEKRNMIIENKNGKIKLLAKSIRQGHTPWNFCYDFATKNSMNEFRDDVLDMIIQKTDQS